MPPELAKIANGIAHIVFQLPNSSPAKRYGVSYIITLVAGGFVFLEVELAARLEVLHVINAEENHRILGLRKEGRSVHS